MKRWKRRWENLKAENKTLDSTEEIQSPEAELQKAALKKGFFSMLGLATKAGKIMSGEFMTEKAVKTYQASLVIVAEDSSDNTKKNFTNMCRYYKVPLYFFGTKESLGKAMGKEMRASLALTDPGFAKALQKKLGNSSNMEV
jgi:ribosomal protein L7Ae-like RNA K-turn-binding protein